MKVNINDLVEVKLTKEGINQYENYCKIVYDKLYYYPNLIGKTLKTELWHLMMIFGDKIYMGGPCFF